MLSKMLAYILCDEPCWRERGERASVVMPSVSACYALECLFVQIPLALVLNNLVIFSMYAACDMAG